MYMINLLCVCAIPRVENTLYKMYLCVGGGCSGFKGKLILGNGSRGYVLGHAPPKKLHRFEECF